ncbi:MAG: hypothetical protein DKINENOH_04196 [bacterium]|nr:hypothetical protein [bacterium]
MGSEMIRNIIDSVIAGIVSSVVAEIIRRHIPIGKDASSSNEPSSSETRSGHIRRALQRTVAFIGRVLIAATAIARSPKLLGPLMAIVTFCIGYWSGGSHSGRFDERDESSIINDLLRISSATVLEQKIKNLEDKGDLVVGEETDFENPENMFVFVLDGDEIYRRLLIQNQKFLDLQTSDVYPDLPKDMSRKRTIWVIETRHLFNPGR